LGREDVREGAHPRAEMAADVRQDLPRGAVSFVREADQPVSVRGGAEGLLRRSRRGEARDVRLEVAAAVAVSLAGATVVDDHHVAELRAPAVRAAKRAAAADDAATEAGAEREHDEVVDAATGAGLPLPDRGGVRVVVEPDGTVESLLHVLAEREVGE